MTNCILKYISKYFVMIVFKIHCKILKMYLNYYLKYMYRPISKYSPSIVANEVKNFQMNLFGGKTAVWRAMAPVPLPGYVTGWR